ncbi:MAG: esterase-like activity of phytase family protein [Vicinamibacteria bacterium]|nr:esterase-like activity of phytase family protein [Vicinamibacteria bacterium]
MNGRGGGVGTRRRSVALLAAGALAAWAGSASGAAPRLEAVSVPLNADDAAQVRVGRLEYRGGLALSSPQPGFGGLSDVRLTGSTARAVSDEGAHFEFGVRIESGRLVGVGAQATSGMLLDTVGNELDGKANQDAESMARLPDGSLLVGFEQRHRVLRYESLAGPAQAWPTPPGLEGAPRNGGLEAMTALADGRVLALTEELEASGQLAAWLWDKDGWAPLRYRAEGDPRPAGAALLPDGDVVVIERSYSPLTGVTARLRRIRAAQIAPGALLEGELLAELKRPLTVDNFEAIEALRGPGGETLLLLLSDDNFNPLQRTLLLLFALD